MGGGRWFHIVGLLFIVGAAINDSYLCIDLLYLFILVLMGHNSSAGKVMGCRLLCPRFDSWKG
jgi:hypothetical protein